MNQSFFHQDFFRYINLDLFNQYLETKNLPHIKRSDPKASQLDLMISYLDKLSAGDAEKVIGDFIKKD